MRWLRASILILLSLPVLAQTQLAPISGFCVNGAKPAITSGQPSSNFNQNLIPGCKVQVFLSGTLTQATIYADRNQTVLSNPFTANPDATWQFFVSAVNLTQAYDVVLSGGTPPNNYSTPRTLVGLLLGGTNGAGGGGIAAYPPVGIAVSTGSAWGTSINPSTLATIEAGNQYVLPFYPNAGSSSTLGPSTITGDGSGNLIVPGHIAVGAEILTGITGSTQCLQANPLGQITGTGVPCSTSAGGGVSSLNSLVGALSITAGAGISVTPLGSNITITNTNTTTAGVSSINTLTGAFTFSGTGFGGCTGTPPTCTFNGGTGGTGAPGGAVGQIQYYGPSGFAGGLATVNPNTGGLSTPGATGAYSIIGDPAVTSAMAPGGVVCSSSTSSDASVAINAVIAAHPNSAYQMPPGTCHIQNSINLGSGRLIGSGGSGANNTTITSPAGVTAIVAAGGASVEHLTINGSEPSSNGVNDPQNLVFPAANCIDQQQLKLGITSFTVASGVLTLNFGTISSFHKAGGILTIQGVASPNDNLNGTYYAATVHNNYLAAITFAVPGAPNISVSAATFNTAVTGTSGSNTVTVASTTGAAGSGQGIIVGSLVQGNAAAPMNTFVTAISGNTLTLSKNLLSSVTASTMYFQPVMRVSSTGSCSVGVEIQGSGVHVDDVSANDFGLAGIEVNGEAPFISDTVTISRSSFFHNRFAGYFGHGGDANVVSQGESFYYFNSFAGIVDFAFLGGYYEQPTVSYNYGGMVNIGGWPGEGTAINGCTLTRAAAASPTGKSVVTVTGCTIPTNISVGSQIITHNFADTTYNAPNSVAVTTTTTAAVTTGSNTATVASVAGLNAGWYATGNLTANTIITAISGTTLTFSGTFTANLASGATLSFYPATSSGYVTAVTPGAAGTGTLTYVQPGYALAAGSTTGGTIALASMLESTVGFGINGGSYVIGLNNNAGIWTLIRAYDEGGQGQTNPGGCSVAGFPGPTLLISQDFGDCMDPNFSMDFLRTLGGVELHGFGMPGVSNNTYKMIFPTAAPTTTNTLLSCPPPGTGSTTTTCTWATTSGSTSVSSLNGLTGAVSIAAGTGISVTNTTGTITIANTGSSGGGMVYPGAGVAVSTGAAWAASIPQTSVALISGPTPVANHVATWVDATHIQDGGAAGVTGVVSINGTAGAFTFTGSGQSCTGTTCTFSGGGGTGTGGPGNQGQMATYLAAGTTNTSSGDTNVYHSATNGAGTFNATDTQGVAAAFVTLGTTGSMTQWATGYYSNDPTVGTTANTLAKIVGATGTTAPVAVSATNADNNLQLYPVLASWTANGATVCGQGTVGQACLVLGGQAQLVFDANGAAANDFVGLSTTAAPNATDLGPAPPFNGSCIGKLISGAVLGGGTGTVQLGNCIEINSKSQLFGYCTGTIGTTVNGTYYMWPTTSTLQTCANTSAPAGGVRFPYAGIVKNLFVSFGTTGASANACTVKFYNAGAASPLQAVIGTTATGTPGYVSDTTHTVPVAQGSSWEFVLVGSSAGSDGCANVTAAAEYDASQ